MSTDFLNDLEVQRLVAKNAVRRVSELEEALAICRDTFTDFQRLFTVNQKPDLAGACGITINAINMVLGPRAQS